MRNYTLELVCDAPCDHRVTTTGREPSPPGWVTMRIGNRDFDLCPEHAAKAGELISRGE